GGGVGWRGAWVGGGGAQRRHHIVERPFEVDGGRTGGGEHGAGTLERFVGGVRAQRQRDAIGRRRSDQGRAADLHGGNGARDLLDTREADGRETVRQHGLIDNADRPAVRLEPDGAGIFAVDFHGARLSRDSSKGKAPLPAGGKR